MTTLDSDFAFGKMFRKATAAGFGLRQEHDAFADTDADGSKAQRGGIAALSIFAGLGIMLVSGQLSWRGPADSVNSATISDGQIHQRCEYGMIYLALLKYILN